MRWPWSPMPEKKAWVGPLRGLRWRDVKVDAPADAAPPEQHLDFAAVAGLWNGYWLGVEGQEVWRERALLAYRAKWGAP
jgi:hypothetical protein